MAVLSIHNGYSVKYLTDAVAAGREAYYTDARVAGEPAGLWFGAGAHALGLCGEVDAELMEAVYSHFLDPRHEATHRRATWGQAPRFARGHNTYRTPEEIYQAKLATEPGAGPERRERLRLEAAKQAKQSLAFVDLTFSAPKSVSVLAVAFQRAAATARANGDQQRAELYAGYHKAVEDAVMAGAQAAIEYLQDQAGYARIGHHGGTAGRWVDAHEFVAAQFLQHDSRDHDPQLHVHNPLLNRVRCADGQWRALDTELISLHRPAAGAIGERVAEAYLCSTVPLWLLARPDGAGREIEGVAEDVLLSFSSRARAISKLKTEEITRLEERLRRELSALERYQIGQRATLVTRQAKTHTGESNDERLARWAEQARAERDGGLDAIVHDVLERGAAATKAEYWSPQDVKARALAMVRDSRQGWRQADLMHYVADALPANLGIRPEQVRPLIEGLTREIMTDQERVIPLQPDESVEHLPPELLLDDGTSSYARPGARRFAAADQIAAERALRAAAVERGALRFTAEEATTALRHLAASGAVLGQDQERVVRGVMTSGARLEILSAPAGTGKSFTVGALGGVWRETQRRVFGLASWQAGAEVLADEGLDAMNVARWLATQRRLDRTTGGDPHGDEQWRMRPGDLVVVDEAGTIPTPDLAEVQRRCHLAGAKLLLVGDPRQLAPVGPGGALADLARRALRYELSEVRRFTNDWEGPASLRLREGDSTALSEYAKHGRLVDGGTTEETEARVARTWLADTLAGRESLVIVPTNEAAARLSAHLRAELVALGKVDEHGVPLGLEGTLAGVGDLVQARKLDWTLIGYQGNTTAPINRQTYRVLDTHDDGSLLVARVLSRDDGTEQLSDTLTLPPEYVSEHLILGYASTVHAAQGRTVDTSHAIAGPHLDSRTAYVMSTRGRLSNTLYAVTHDLTPDASHQERADAAAVMVGESVAVEETSPQQRSALSVLATALERADSEEHLSALAQREEADEDARSTAQLDRLVAEIDMVTAGRTGAILDQLAAEGVLPAEHRVGLATDENIDSVDNAVRRAELTGHDPHEMLRSVLAGRSLDGSRSTGWVLADRIDRALRKTPPPRLTSYADLIPANIPELYQQRFTDLADAADERRRELGTRTAREMPEWAVTALGPVPEGVVEREEWEHRAGWLAAHREWNNHTDNTDVLGSTPGAARPEQRAAWSTAAAMLTDEPTATDEQCMSEGQLRVRVRAMERETAWAPRWVNLELNAVSRAEHDARDDAELTRAHADVTDDHTERDRLLSEAAAADDQARAFADQREALERTDLERSAWYEHTRRTRDAAQRARQELIARGIAIDAPSDQVTAAEWLEAHRADQLAEDDLRPVSETDVADSMNVDERGRHDEHRLDDVQVETDVADIRETSTRDATEDHDDARAEHVPTAEETNEILARLRAAHAEQLARQQAEAAERDRHTAEQAEAAVQHDELLRREEDHQAAEATTSDQQETADVDS